MIDRWSLARAGIINVYQYGQETLEFAGGRLLLRGVNGSGKSTAMNMLLPFLLDGDTRRIDAAGEQAGVLKAWMLSGRDDAQPVGYLWVEFARGDDHLTCGCGIRASRASDTVTTWWFVTSRRPGVDLDLVEAQHPLSMESLRGTLGADPVFRHDQRRAYRAEVRARLFGGADIDQHIRLLHVVRNPRVGDRIDVELPGHLHDALPQLSDAALDDAAQPLDDLEEHRRNVEDLTRTATTLDALRHVYSSYARSDLRRRGADARRLVDEATRARREKDGAERAAVAAAATLARVTEAVDRLAGDEVRLRRELEGLRESPAYQEGRELNHLRDHVRSLQSAIGRAEQDGQRRAAATGRAHRSLADLERGAVQDQRALAGQLRDLAACVMAAGLPLSAPDAPTLPTVTLETREPTGSVVEVPGRDLDPAPLRHRLGELRRAVVHRRGDLEELQAELAAVDVAERRLGDAQRASDAAEAEAGVKREVFAVARRALDEALRTWRAELAAWLARLEVHRRANRLAGGEAPDLDADLATRRDEVVTALAAVADATIEAHLRERAGLEARRDAEQVLADELAALVAELEARVLPSPPTLPWQGDGGDLVLAELIDFHPSVDPAARAGVEAAMEAAGLLGATVTAAGALELVAGGLVVGPGRPAPEPLTRLLTVTVPDDRAVEVDAGIVTRLLDTISTDPEGLDGEDDRTVVTVDGRFRTGVLRGHHTKPEAEHIGRTARRAALERQRAAARDRLGAAEAVLAGTDRELAAGRERITAARSLRAELPAVTALARSVLLAEAADAEAARTFRVQTERRAERDRAEDLHGEAVDKSRRTAANLSLPTDPEGLRRVDADLRQSTSLAERADGQLTGLVRAVTQWRRAGDDWERARHDERQAAETLAAARAEHEPVAARLATLEDSIGVAYAEIVAAIGACEADEKRTSAELEAARGTQLGHRGELAATEAHAAEMARRHDQATALSVAALPGLRRALLVPGFLTAIFAGTSADTHPPPGGIAADGRAAVLAPVEETPEGVRALTAAIQTHVPAPDRADVSAEGVRQSLRQRRDSLGAGWDAEDRQADELLPLAVEVNGPEGRMPLAEATAVVGARLRQLTALLSAEQDGALRNLLQGLVAKEVAEKLYEAQELVKLINRRLDTVATSHGIGVLLNWRRRDSLDAGLTNMIDLLAKPPDLRTAEQDQALRSALAERLRQARGDDPEAPYRDLIGRVLDYRSWYDMILLLRRPGRPNERLTRRTALSEGEKKIVSYLPLFSAVAASCDSLAAAAPDAPRFVLLDDAFAKVSEDNHPMLFGLLVELDLDFIATSERLWGTHATVPELAITEVLRDADLGVIVLEHSRWDGTARTEQP